MAETMQQLLDEHKRIFQEQGEEEADEWLLKNIYDLTDRSHG